MTDKELIRPKMDAENSYKKFRNKISHICTNLNTEENESAKNYESNHVVDLKQKISTMLSKEYNSN